MNGKPQANVKQQAVSSTMWTMARTLSDQVFSFLVFVVVARILGPADVGLFALGMIVVELGRIFSTSGFSDAVTRARADDEEDVARAAFWGNIMLSLLSAVVLSLAAVPIARLLDSPRLAGVVVALAWTIPLSGAYAIHQARLLKRFGHRSLAIRSVLSGLIGGAVAIFAAWHGAGVWSLVVQRVVTELIALATIWLSFRWWPGFGYSRARMREIMAFAAHISASRLGNTVTGRIQDVLIGIYVSAAAVGVYRVAKRTIDMMITGGLTSFSTIAFQVFAAVRDEDARLRAAILRSIGICSTAAFPLFAGVAVVAPDLIPLIYGPKWTGSIVLLQVLTLVCLPALFSLLTTSVLSIHGAGRAVSSLTLVQLVLSVVFSLATAPFGMMAVVLGMLVRNYLMIPYQIGLVSRHSGCTRRQILMAMARPLLASLVMAALCYMALLEMTRIFGSPVVRLALTGILGAAVYGGLLWVIDRQSLRWLLELLRGRVRRRT